MDISMQVVTAGDEIVSTSERQWVQVKGRSNDANVGRVVGSKQMDNGIGHCYWVLFEETGEVAMYRARDTKPVSARA